MANILRKNWLLIGLLMLFAIYMGVYIFQTSFISNGTRYFVLFDDAMISMRFAKNFAEGFGLVWNPGESPVEGYTNPLWVIFMAFFHLFPIPASKISIFIQISGALFLLANLVFVKKITEEISEDPIAPYLALILTGLYVPLNDWGLQGMEVSGLVLLVSAVSFLAIRSIKHGMFSKWIYILLFVGTLIRMDIVVPYLVFWGFLVIFDAKNRKQHLLWGFGLLAFSLIGQTLFRHFYYGDLLPNTYYLKMTGISLVLRVKRGLFVFYHFLRDFNWVLFIIPFLVILIRLNLSTILLALVFSAQIAYSVYVGGDAWEHVGGANRYLSIAMPLFFILFAYGWEQIKNSLSAAVKDQKFIINLTGNIGVVLVVLLSLLNFNFMKENQNNIKRMFLLYEPHFIEGNKWNLEIVQAVKSITTNEAVIAVTGAGSIPYFTERHSYDVLGKIDSYIAHLPNHIPSGGLVNIRPGHMKWDYEYTFGQLKPDMILGIWENREEAEPILTEYYTTISVDGMNYLVRKDSPEILWDLVDQEVY